MKNNLSYQLSEFQKGFLEGMEYIQTRMFYYQKNYIEDNVQHNIKQIRKIYKQIIKDISRDFENQIMADELGMLDTFTYDETEDYISNQENELMISN